MEVFDAYERVFLMAKKFIDSQEPSAEKAEQEEALSLAVKYYLAQMADYTSPDALPESESIRRLKAWKKALEEKEIPVPQWLRSYQCKQCEKMVDLDELTDRLCQECEGIKNGSKEERQGQG